MTNLQHDRMDVMEADPKALKKKGFYRYEPWLEEEIFQFQRESYPNRAEAFIAPRWRWMFLASAARLDVALDTAEESAETPDTGDQP